MLFAILLNKLWHLIIEDDLIHISDICCGIYSQHKAEFEIREILLIFCNLDQVQ